VTVDYPDDMAVSQQMLSEFFGVSSQVAALIATGQPGGAPGGVPLLNFANVIVNLGTTSIGTSESVFPSTGTYAISQIGYEGQIDIQTGNAGATFLGISLQWSDPGGVAIANDTFWLAVPGGTNENTVRFSGPTKGQQLQIFMESSTGTVTVNNLRMDQTSRVYINDRWYSRNFSGTFPGFANIPQADISANTIAAISVSIPTVTTSSWLLPMYTGRAALIAQTLSGAADLAISIANASDTHITNGFVYTALSDATGRVYQPLLVLPRAECQLNLRNTNAAAETVTCQLVAADY
jgi:hypothetical protein